MNTSSFPAPQRRTRNNGFGRFCLSAYCMDGGFFLIMAALPFKLLAMGGGPIALGMAPAIAAIVYIVATLQTGRRSDHTGRGTLCLAGSLVLLAFALAAWLANTVEMLLALTPLLGLGKALYWPVVEAAVADLSEARRLERNLALFNSAWCGGKTTGFLALGLLLAAGDFRLAFCCGGVLALGAFFTLPSRRRLNVVTPTAPAIETESDVWKIPENRRALFRRLGWAANTSTNAVAVIFAAHLPALFLHRDWSEGRFGLFLGLIFLTQTATFLFLSRRRLFTFTTRPLFASQLIVIVISTLMPWLDTFPLLLAVAAPLGVSFGICYSASLFYSLHGPSERGRHAGIHEALIGFAGFLPPLAAGLLIAACGWLGASCLLAAALAIAALAWQWCQLRGGFRKPGGKTCS